MLLSFPAAEIHVCFPYFSPGTLRASSTATSMQMIRQQMIDKATRELEATRKAEDNKEEKEVSGFARGQLFSSSPPTLKPYFRPRLLCSEVCVSLLFSTPTGRRRGYSPRKKAFVSIHQKSRTLTFPRLRNGSTNISDPKIHL